MQKANVDIRSAGNQFVVAALFILLFSCSGNAQRTYTYSYSNLFDGGINRTAGFNEFEMLRAVEEGLALWASVSPLTFIERVDSGPAPSDESYAKANHPEIRIGHHGLSGNTLGHAFFPGNNGLDGDLHMDSSNRTWSESLFFSTMTHELGHTIGLSHIDLGTAVMNPSITSDNTLPGIDRGFLFPRDISAVQNRHGRGQGDVISYRAWEGTVNDRWSNHDNWERGWRPTKYSDVTLGGDTIVQISSPNQEASRLALGIGNNELKVADAGSISIRNDVVLGTTDGGPKLINSEAAARTFIPINSSIHETWFGRTFDDSSWTLGETGIGYERNSGFEHLINTDVESRMFNRNASVYTRVDFDVEDPNDLTLLALRMKYDDGFVAYLNGTRVAAANHPNTIQWNSKANRSREDEDAVQFVEFDLTSQINLLRTADNVLAIQGLNQSRTSSDMLILPELVGGGLENKLTVEGGSMNIAGDLVLAQHGRSRAELLITGGEFNVNGNITAGKGFKKLTISGGTLSVRALGTPSTLIRENARARYLIPSDNSADSDWTGIEFDDSQWTSSRGGFGYERNSGFEGIFNTDLESQMYSNNSTFYSRYEFEVADIAEVDLLTLKMKFDDGFVAFLNGEQVISENAPNTIRWNSAANSSIEDEDAMRFIEFDLSSHRDKLREGSNVFAIQGLNRSTTSSDFLIVPELTTATVNGSIKVDQLNFTGGRILGVTSIEGSFRHFANRFSPTGVSESSRIESLTIGGRYAMESTAILGIDIATPDQHDLMTVLGTAALDGRLDLNVGDEYEDPSEQGTFDKFVFLTATLLSGEFNAIQYDGTLIVPGHQEDGLFRWIQYENGEVSLTNYQAVVGDANGDGEFESGDLITAFQAGQYEDDIPFNSSWTEGDWNGDLEFDSTDFIAAFQAGVYETGSIFEPNLQIADVPEPHGGQLSVIVVSFLMLRSRRRD